MSTPIDATLASFITQAVREAMAEERRINSRERRAEKQVESRDRRWINSERRLDESQPTVAFNNRDDSNQIRKMSNCQFGALTSNKLAQERPNPFTWGCSFTQPTNPDTNTKKVRIGELPVSESRYSFTMPQTQSMAASTVSTPPTTSNSVANRAYDIPNKNDSFNIIFGADNGVLKQNKNMQTNEYKVSAKTNTRPCQPNYPPPIYSGSSELPELISDSEGDVTKDNLDGEKTSLDNLQTAFDSQVPDAITGILSSLLGVDMTKELEGLADELLGGKKHTTSSTVNTTPAKTPTVHQADKKPEHIPTVPHRVFSDAYCAFVKYLFNEVNVSPSVKQVIEEHLINLVRDRFNEVNTSQTSYPYYTKYTNHWQDTTTRVVKAICVELSCSHRLSALEDIIKNIAIEDLHKFKDFMNEIKI